MLQQEVLPAISFNFIFDLPFRLIDFFLFIFFTGSIIRCFCKMKGMVSVKIVLKKDPCHPFSDDIGPMIYLYSIWLQSALPEPVHHQYACRNIPCRCACQILPFPSYAKAVHWCAIKSGEFPFSGVTPEASAKVIDRGRAIIATIIPEITSLKNCGLYSCVFISSVGTFKLNSTPFFSS